MVARTHLTDTFICILPVFEIQEYYLAKADALLNLSTRDFPLSSTANERASTAVTLRYLGNFSSLLGPAMET
jgi:hypothetical protein